jgi:hypothetical protein
MMVWRPWFVILQFMTLSDTAASECLTMPSTEIFCAVSATFSFPFLTRSASPDMITDSPPATGGCKK